MATTAAARDQNLDELRALMAAHSPPLHALLVPSEDAHQSEYVSERDKRREFISGFTGSAGLALITAKEALLWTDGRYFLQATQQLSDLWRLMRMGEDPPVEVWIADNLSDEAVIGIDPWCISVDSAQRYELAFSKKRQTLCQLSSDLVDEIWKDRPPNDALPVIVHPVEFAGRSVAEKIKELREKLQHEKASGIILTALDEVAWLYNVRGDDVHYSPVVHAYAIVTLYSAFFYVDKGKVTAEVQNYMAENGIDIREYHMVQPDVSLLASGQLKGSAVNDNSHLENDINGVDHSKIWIDSNSCCLALYSKLSLDQVLMLQSPIALPKAVKNPTELDGLRKAHVRDGAAVVQYLAWLDNQVSTNIFLTIKDLRVKTTASQDFTSRVLSRLPLPRCMGTPARAPSDAVTPLPAPQPAVSTMSTAQILRASGYSAAEPAALRALSDIAIRYITSLGRAASAIADARGRTEPNLLDLTLALEDHSVGGFPGASDPTRPVLRSGVLSELARFVCLVKEVPFAKLLPRLGGDGLHHRRWESFMAAGKEPPLRHVPGWLPCFPEEQETSLEVVNKEETKVKWEMRRLGVMEIVEFVKVDGDGKEGRGVVPEKRGKVRFLMGKKKRRRVGFDICGGGFEQFVENKCEADCQTNAVAMDTA